jgi:hypothetical protein
MRIPLLFSMTVAEQAGISHFNLVTLNWAPLATNHMLVPPPFHVKVGFTAGPSWLLYSEPLLPANTLVRLLCASQAAFTTTNVLLIGRHSCHSCQMARMIKRLKARIASRAHSQWFVGSAPLAALSLINNREWFLILWPR